MQIIDLLYINAGGIKAALCLFDLVAHIINVLE